MNTCRIFVVIDGADEGLGTLLPIVGGVIGGLLLVIAVLCLVGYMVWKLRYNKIRTRSSGELVVELSLTPSSPPFD